MLSKEVWLSGQIEDIKEEELGAVFKAYSETIKDKVDKMDETELLKLLAKEVARMDFFAVPTIQKPIAAILKLNFKVINLLKELLFTAWCTSKPINSFSTGIKFNNFLN